MIPQPHTTKPRRPWAEIVATKRSIREDTLHKYQPEREYSRENTLGEKLVDINDITTLLETGQVSALELIRTYIGRQVYAYISSYIKTNRRYRACEAQVKVTVAKSHYLKIF
jgi:hypothetical protein